eukprot:TRINITY_DN2685_c0_g1_i1.p1 TRINITY_DN2685_c0_g1~~TRINITY_DN2685_c0_g1_i1.p1  ORF type:complete len:91 (+),score=1.81 TRINITY_DN2685_c0_g1_i1:68-340(+)
MLESGVLPAIILYLISIPVSRYLFGYGQLYKNHRMFCKKITFAYNVLMTIYSGYTAFFSWKILIEEYDYATKFFEGFGSPDCKAMWRIPC